VWVNPSAPCRFHRKKLGVDSVGRSYWLLPTDPSRLWVEAPTLAKDTAGSAAGDTEGGSAGGTDTAGWGWAFYERREYVARLVASLNGREAGSAEVRFIYFSR